MSALHSHLPESFLLLLEEQSLLSPIGSSFRGRGLAEREAAPEVNSQINHQGWDEKTEPSDDITQGVS